MSTDPRQLPGAIVGDTDPHGQATVLLDASNAVILQEITVSTIDHGARGRQDLYAMLLSGRVNQTRDQANVLFVLDPDAVASIISELMALIGRTGDRGATETLIRLRDRIDDLEREGNLAKWTSTQ